MTSLPYPTVPGEQPAFAVPTEGVTVQEQVATSDEKKLRRPKMVFNIEGINNDLRSISGWHLVFEDRINYLPGPDKSNSYSYHVGPVSRWTQQGSNIKKAGKIIERCWNSEVYDLVLVGHSNGCPIICGLLKECQKLLKYVDQVHFYAPAAFADFNDPATGLNDAFARAQIGKLFINCSTSDRALRLAQKTSVVRWFNKKWGYGSMGLTGPLGRTTIAAERSEVKFYDNYDHSTWFEPSYIDTTFQELVTRIG